MHMHKNLGRFDRFVRLALGAFALFAAAVLFENLAAKAAAAVIGAFVLWEYAVGFCPLYAALGVRSPNERLHPDALHLLGLAAVQAVIAYSWIVGGWEKIVNPDFASGIGKTLGYFASKNPFPWYKAFLLGPATSNAGLFALAVEWGELAAGAALAITLAGILVSSGARRRKALLLASAALAAGMLMNANFYFAAGWTGAGTKGDNIVMFWAQAALLYVWVSSLGPRGAKRREEANANPV
jgi:hypothetical protein